MITKQTQIGRTLKDELTALEYERAGLLMLGMDYRAIGYLTGLTELGVRMRFRAIFEKTGTSDRLELAVRYAHEMMDRSKQAD